MYNEEDPEVFNYLVMIDPTNCHMMPAKEIVGTGHLIIHTEHTQLFGKVVTWCISM